MVDQASHGLATAGVNGHTVISEPVVAAEGRAEVASIAPNPLMEGGFMFPAQEMMEFVTGPEGSRINGGVLGPASLSTAAPGLSLPSAQWLAPMQLAPGLCLSTGQAAPTPVSAPDAQLVRTPVVASAFPQPAAVPRPPSVGDTEAASEAACGTCVSSSAAASPRVTLRLASPTAAAVAPQLAIPAQSLVLGDQSVQLENGDCVAGMRRLPTGSVDLAIADPPYNIAVQGSAWDTVPNYMAWSAQWLNECARVLKPGGSLFIYGSPEKLWISRLKIIAADTCHLDFVQHLSWVYKSGGDARMKGMNKYSVRMEHCEWFVKPGGAHTFHASAAAEHYTEEEAALALAKGVGRVTPESLQQGRPPRNWFEIPRENSRSKERKYGAHPSMKPLALCDRLIQVHSNAGDTVLIPFGGSGSECVSAALLGRRLIAFELEEEYYAVMLRRMHGHRVLPARLVPLVRELEAPAAAAPSPGASDLVDETVELLRSERYTSGYVGVYKQGKKWVAKEMVDGRMTNIGVYATPREAACAYARRTSGRVGALPPPPEGGDADRSGPPPPKRLATAAPAPTPAGSFCDPVGYPAWPGGVAMATPLPPGGPSLPVAIPFPVPMATTTSAPLMPPSSAPLLAAASAHLAPTLHVPQLPTVPVPQPVAPPQPRALEPTDVVTERRGNRVRVPSERAIAIGAVSSWQAVLAHDKCSAREDASAR